jgi:hypothetical protein
VVCTAGLDRPGTVIARVLCWLSPEPARTPFEALFPPPDRGEAERRQPEVSVEPADFNDEVERLGWVGEALRPGDEVVVRVLDAGEADRPTTLERREPPF